VRRSFLALLAVSLAAVAPGAGEERAASGPRLRVEPEGFDFGRALPGKTLRKEFTLRNFGDAYLVLESVTSSCGCTAALPEQKRIAPGGATTLRVTFETRSYAGRVEREILVRSNDSKTPLVPIRVSATVEAPPPRPPAK
jgi:hypothetical protein